MTGWLDPVLFLASVIVSWTVVHVIRRRAIPLRLLDVPTHRSMHFQVTPRGGGAAIVVVTLIGFAVAAALGTRPVWQAFVGYLAGSLVIAVVSFVDDILSLPSGIRLAAHFAGAAIVVSGLGLGGWLIASNQTGYAWLVLIGAVIWTAGLTNAYNFMDGIDGLAATEGVVGGLGWTLLGALSHQAWLGLGGVVVGAGCTGFLVHNWPPARIFMGDVGSAFLGFTFAFFTLAALRESPRVAVVSVLLLWPFIFDASVTLLRRLMRGENIFVAHRSHIYQRLVLAGWRQSSVTLTYGFLAIVTFGFGVVWLVTPSAASGYFVIGAVAAASLGLSAVVVRSEHRVSRPGDPRPLIGR